MKLTDIILDLNDKGYNIEYRQRTDGGVIVTSINGVKYAEAKGNTAVRNIAGVSLSEAQKTQLSFNVQKFIKGGRKPKQKLDDEIKARIKAVQRTWRKNKVTNKGRITTRKVRYHLKHEGKKETLRYLDRMERYAQGYAYAENVEALANYMERLAVELEHLGVADEFNETADLIRDKADIFKEDWIAKVYEVMYDTRKSRSREEALSYLNKIKDIIGL